MGINLAPFPHRVSDLIHIIRPIHVMLIPGQPAIDVQMAAAPIMPGALMEQLLEFLFFFKSRAILGFD